MWALPLATSAPLVDAAEDEPLSAEEERAQRLRDRGRPQDDRLVEAFWALYAVTAPWLPEDVRGERDWKSLRLGYGDEDDGCAESDPWNPFDVFDAVTRFIADEVADRSRQRTLLLYSDYLALYVSTGGPLFRIDEEAAWHRESGVPWP